MRLIISLAAVLFCCTSHAQDLIVTQEGDSMNCFIYKKTAGFIYYKIADEKTGRARQSLIPKDRIKYMQKDFYDVVAIPQIAIEKEQFTNLRLAIHGGYSRRLASNPDNISPFYEEYLNQVKNGYVIGAEASYFWSRESGAGLKYGLHRSKANETGRYNGPSPFTNADTNFVLSLSDDISIHYIGPVYSRRFISKDGTGAAIVNLSGGYTFYKDNVTDVEDYTIKAHAFGLSIDIGYDFNLSSNLALGVMVSFTTGYFEDFEIEASDGVIRKAEYPDGEGDNLSRLEISAGLRFLQ